MPKQPKKKSTRKRKRETSDVMPPLDPMRIGMPAQDSIVGVREMKRGGKVFRILKTDEIDEYEATRKPRKKPGR